jgi:hypothetical protein
MPYTVMGVLSPTGIKFNFRVTPNDIRLIFPPSKYASIALSF